VKEEAMKTDWSTKGPAMNQKILTEQILPTATNTPSATVMQITPRIAAAMLATSPGNRRLRGWYVDQLSAAMKRGEWRVTSQGIGMDVHGRLRDAHHRLNACVQSGVSFPSVVVIGLPEDAYQVTDVGMLRTYADRLDEDRRVSDVLRIGCMFALGTSQPTIDQMRPFIDAGLGASARALVEYYGAKRRYYSTAPIKLAACVTIMNGGDADYVMRQYRALCALEFDAMSNASQSLVRQVENGKTKASDPRDALARGFRVFDKDRAGVTRIQVSDADVDAAVDLVRAVLRNSVAAAGKSIK
jgi:hypothetical protein